MMLNNYTLNKLVSLKLVGMAHNFESQLSDPSLNDLSFEERFGVAVDSEVVYRQNQLQTKLLKNAKLRFGACMEDVDYRHSRGLDKSVLGNLKSTEWVSRGLNVIITGPTGSGKTWLSCALGNQTCRNGQTVLFQRVSLLLEDLTLAHADGSFRKKLIQLAKVDLLILDDLGVGTLNESTRHDLLEIIETRSGLKSTIITSQIPVDQWHDYIGGANKTTADSFLDRVLSGTYRFNLSGESMRQKPMF